jgi:hypothetical protein
MSDINATLHHLTAIAEHFGNKHAQFILDHGRGFDVDGRTFKCRRMEMKACFGNAAKMVARDPSLTYVEGYANAIIPFHHAWVMRPDGSIIDPTLRIKGRKGDMPRDYFGVPFSRLFLQKFLVSVGTYGLLDGMSKMSIDLQMGKIEPTEFLATFKEAA